jgi:hypothetical protein
MILGRSQKAKGMMRRMSESNRAMIDPETGLAIRPTCGLAR